MWILTIVCIHIDEMLLAALTLQRTPVEKRREDYITRKSQQQWKHHTIAADHGCGYLLRGDGVEVFSGPSC